MTTTPNADLSNAERTVLEAVLRIRENNRACSVAEITRSVGWSRTYVVNICQTLRDRGLINWTDNLAGSIHATSTVEIASALVGMQHGFVMDGWMIVGLPIGDYVAWRTEYDATPTDGWQQLWWALGGDLDPLQQALPPAPECLLSFTRQRLGLVAEPLGADIELPSAPIPPSGKQPKKESVSTEN
jgi:hypothetical protein